MSQKKVDAYKARKSTRGRADKKEKMMFTLEMFAWAFISYSRIVLATEEYPMTIGVEVGVLDMKILGEIRHLKGLSLLKALLT